MTNLEKLSVVRQSASERLLHIIVEAYEAGTSPHENPSFAPCIAIVQGIEIAWTVVEKFDAPTQLAAKSPKPGQGAASNGGEETTQQHLEGKSFQVNSNTMKEGDII
jgi:hypothetical protein